MLRASGIIIAVLVVLAIAAYFIWKPSGQPAAKATASAGPTAAEVAKAGPPDAVRDLVVERATMGKDVSGLRVRWSVTLRNKSNVYTYSNFKYEADFIGPDGRTLSTSADTIPGSIAPGEEKTLPDFTGGMYNPNAATYHFRLVGATSTK